MAYKIAICDDCASDRHYISDIVRTWASERGLTVHTDAFPSAESFLFHYAESRDHDIVLADIEMGALDGVSMAKKLRRDNDAVQIVFITGFADHIADGYDVGALHYLMKPVRQEKLFSVLDRAVAALNKAEKVLLLPLGGETLRLPTKSIEYVEAFSHSVCFVTEAESISVKMPISEAERKLGGEFVRCHRSYLVGLKHIARLSKTEVILDSGRVLPLARSAASAVHKAFIDHYAEGKDETV